ncbi:MAG: hypothetical protein LBU34_06745 [Planctomycetaceae bacterium]|jgi:hypothetical protein|nr:hypothetical protein [Planctomycetaceae bacterium]
MSKRRKYQDVSELMLPEPAIINPSQKHNPAKPNPKLPPQNPKPATDFRRIIVMPLRILGSLAVGIIILAVVLPLLAWGTLIESEYGAAVARFTLYDSRWFVLLWAGLGLNILCALLLRLPWKWSHLPFVMAHCGILVLLAGCYLTWSGGEIAQITLPEGTVGTKAMKPNRQHFTIRPIAQNTLQSTLQNTSSKQESWDIPFESGPFSWDDYDASNWNQQNRKYRTSLRLAMQWGHRDKGELRVPLRNVKFEVLNYLAGSTTEPVPPLELSILWKKTMRTTTDLGDVKEIPRNWERVRLEIKPQEYFGRMEIRGVQTEMAGGERINYRAAISMTETEAFQNGLPDQNTNSESRGHVVLYHNGKNYSVDVDRLLRETENNKRFRLDGSPFELDKVQFNSRGPVITFALITVGGEIDRLTLFPDNPEMNIQAQRAGVFGFYWLNPEKLAQNPDYADHPILQRLSLPRLDILQGTDKNLYYRFWNGRNITSHGVVPSRSAGKKPQFSVAEKTPDEAEIVVERFVPQDLPGLRILALPVGRGQEAVQRVQLRVTIDGKEDTFWLRAVEKSVVPLPPERDQIRYVHGNTQSVQIQWNYDTVELGFGIFLKKFEMRTEPGTRMSSHYSSLVDFVEMRNHSDNQPDFSRTLDDFRVYENGRSILISMNNPSVFRGTGRSYRIYQSSYAGPYHPDNPWFYELYDGNIFAWEKTPRESLYMSTLSINADPGRGLKYLGSFFIIFGSAWFLYRKKEKK